MILGILWHRRTIISCAFVPFSRFRWTDPSTRQLTHGLPSTGRVFFQGISSYIPLSVLGFIQDHGRSSAVAEARKVTELANKIAKELVTEKTRALDAGKGKRDIMSLLGQLKFLLNEIPC